MAGGQRRIGRTGFLIVAVLVAVAPGAAARSAPRAPRDVVLPQLLALHVGAPAVAGGLPRILDSQRREVLLRGVNLTGLRDDYVADGSQRPPYPVSAAAYAGGACPATNPGVYMAPVCAADAGRMAGFGFDVARIPVSWSLLEPSPGRIDTGAVDRIAQVVGWLRQHGIYSVIDLHQDAWSKYLVTPAGAACPPGTSTVGGFHEADGAPAWASAHLAPVCAAGGVRDLDAAVQEDFQRLYSDLPGPDGVGLQEHYAGVVTALARRFARNPAVAGYELLNEPEPGYAGPGVMDASELFPFYAKTIAAVRAALPAFRQLVFLEPDVTRDVTDRSVTALPWSAFSSYPNVVYAPHVYTNVFTLNAELGLSALGPLFTPGGGYDSAARDAKTLGTPLFIGEFGNGTEQDPTLLRDQFANQDRLAVGGALWYWKGQANKDGHWSVLYDDAPHTDAEWPNRRRYADRAYPIATAGRIDALSYTPSTGTFELRADGPRVAPGRRDRASVIHVPASATGALTATNAELAVVAGPGAGRTVYAFPHGGAYAVRIAAR